jgi:hypothetical protein
LQEKQSKRRSSGAKRSSLWREYFCTFTSTVKPPFASSLALVPYIMTKGSVAAPKVVNLRAQEHPAQGDRMGHGEKRGSPVASRDLSRGAPPSPHAACVGTNLHQVSQCDKEQHCNQEDCKSKRDTGKTFAAIAAKTAMTETEGSANRTKGSSSHWTERH